MSDIVSPEKRSQMMAGIRGKDTRPELLVRKGLHKRGFRYKLHDRSLPGKPDLCLPKYRAVIFVHGCFWHYHNCKLFKWPKSNKEFWNKKITSNVTRDKLQSQKLKDSNWRILVVWECALKGKNRKDVEKVIDKIADWVLSDSNCGELP